MPIQPGWVKVVLHGALAQGEIWETGFWMTGTGVANSQEADALALLIYGTLSSADSSGAMRITLSDICNALTTWSQVRTYVYSDTSGRATYQGVYDITPALPGSTSTYLPNQVAAVLTLRTPLAGRRHRGRMYLPASGSEINIDGQLAQVTLNGVAAAWAQAFTDINASDTGKIVVASATGSSAQQVTQVTMDSRLDIQRRRANKQAILRHSSDPVTP